LNRCSRVCTLHGHHPSSWWPGSWTIEVLPVKAMACFQLVKSARQPLWAPVYLSVWPLFVWHLVLPRCEMSPCSAPRFSPLLLRDLLFDVCERSGQRHGRLPYLSA
jgi:hypothetical protein